MSVNDWFDVPYTAGTSRNTGMSIPLTGALSPETERVLQALRNKNAENMSLPKEPTGSIQPRRLASSVGTNTFASREDASIRQLDTKMRGLSTKDSMARSAPSTAGIDDIIKRNSRSLEVLKSAPVNSMSIPKNATGNVDDCLFKKHAVEGLRELEALGGVDKLGFKDKTGRVLISLPSGGGPPRAMTGRLLERMMTHATNGCEVGDERICANCEDKFLN